MKTRYTLEAAPRGGGDGTWLVRAADGAHAGSLNLIAAYERDAIGRAHHALYATLYLPVPPGSCHPYATCRIWERDPHVSEPLEVHMPLQPHCSTDLLADAQLAQARVLLSDLWLGGELRRLYHRIMR